MTSLDPVLASVDPILSRKERLQKAFKELETLSSCSNKWKELEEHFSNVEKAIQKRRQDLVVKERALEEKAQEMEAALKKREDAIQSREENSSSLVEQQQGLGNSEKKRKRQEVKEMPKSVAMIYSTTESAELTHRTSLDSMRSNDDGYVDPGVSKEDNNSISMKPASLNEKVNPLLKSLCEKMDGEGVRNFLEANMKNVHDVNTELPAALEFAANPSRLVLEALKDFPLGERVDAPNEKKAFRVSLTQRALVTMLEALTAVLTDPLLGEGHVVVPSDSKNKAKALAQKWESEMDIFGNYPHKSVLNVQAFLQLLAAFDLVELYDEESICKLITHIGRRKQTAILCKALRMSHKLIDVVHKLAEQGKQFDAVLFAQACGIMDKIQPVTLLKAFVEDAKKSAQEMLKSRNSSPSAQNDAGMKEMLALKAVLGIIAEHELEPQYPSALLKRRVEELEKAKEHRKQIAAAKAQAKRARTNERTAGGPKGSTVTDPHHSNKGSDQTQFGGSSLSYTVPGMSPYAHGQAGLSATYRGASRTPISLSDSLSFGSSILRTPSYTSPSIYSTYLYGGGLLPPPPAYQAALLR